MNNQEPTEAANVIQMFLAPKDAEVPPLSDAEVLLLRQFIQEFAIIRATCPLAVRALATRS